MGTRITFSESPAEKFEDIDPVLEFYQKGDYNFLFEWINNAKIKDFTNELELVRANVNGIELPKDINDVSMNVVTEKSNQIRNATTIFFMNRRGFVAYQEIWVEMGIILNSLSKEEKDRISLDESIKKLSSADLRSAETNFRMNNVTKLKTKVDVYNSRLRYIDNEFNLIMKDLESLKFENSRYQSAVALALDTGEIPRIYWKKDQNN